MKKISGKVLRQRLFNFFGSILIAAIIIAGTFFVALYAYGYRVSLDKNTLERTGVLSIDSNPAWANIFVNNEDKGTTSRTLGSIPEGTYNIRIEKDGYQSWQTTVPVQAELSTPVQAYMFYANATKSQPYKLENTPVTSVQISQNNDHYFITTTKITSAASTQIQQATTTTKTPTATKTITIYDYRINKSFWDFAENPKQIFQITIPATDETTLYPSNSGEFAYFTVKTVTSTTKPATTPATPATTVAYIINTGTPQPKPVDIALNDFYTSYKFTWAKDNRHIILEADNEILSYDVNSKSIVLLLKKSTGQKNIVWNTDEGSYFYYLDSTTKPTPYFTIKQVGLDGTNQKVLLDQIYWQSDKKYLSDKDILNTPFTDAPQTTLFCGAITGFYPNPDQKGIVIETEFAIYWYDTLQAKYELVAINPSKFLAFSPDKTKFSYVDTVTNSLNVFTYEVRDLDHVSKIGSKTLLANIQDLNVNSIKWLQNSLYIGYIKDNMVYATDIDGINTFKLVDVTNEETGDLYTIDYQVQNVLIPAFGQTGISIDKYQIH